MFQIILEHFLPSQILCHLTETTILDINASKLVARKLWSISVINSQFLCSVLIRIALQLLFEALTLNLVEANYAILDFAIIIFMFQMIKKKSLFGGLVAQTMLF